MAQVQTPVYGEQITDLLIGRSQANRPGIVVVPAVSVDAARATINPDAFLGFWAWKTRWTLITGSFQIVETEPFTVDHLDSSHPNQVLVGRWKWVEGPIDLDGHPTGTQTDAMKAVYSFESVPGGDLADTVIETSIAQPDVNGRYGVVLGRLQYTGGVWVFSFAPATLLDDAYNRTRPIGSPFSNIADAVGEIAHGGTIPLPHYPNGDIATIGQIKKLFVSPKLIVRGAGGEASVWNEWCFVNPATLVVSCYTVIVAGGGGANFGAAGVANYLIECRR